jgi:hypothetical protein
VDKLGVTFLLTTLIVCVLVLVTTLMSPGALAAAPALAAVAAPAFKGVGMSLGWFLLAVFGGAACVCGLGGVCSHYLQSAYRATSANAIKRKHAGAQASTSEPLAYAIEPLLTEDPANNALGGGPGYDCKRD